MNEMTIFMELSRMYQKSKSINRKGAKTFAKTQRFIFQYFDFACLASTLRTLRLKMTFETSSGERSGDGI